MGSEAKIRAVLFDIDNTLVNFMRMKRHAVDAASDAMIDAGLKIPKQDFVEKIFQTYRHEGIEDQQIFNKILTEVLGELDYKILAAGILGYRRAKEAFLAVYPHVHPTLTALVKMGIRLGVISDAPKLQVWMRVVGLGLSHYFDTVVTFDDTRERKPSPKPFELALKNLGCEPAQSLMIGDWLERDIVGAKNVGMKAVFARYGDEFNTPADTIADFDVMDIAALVEIVRRLNGPDSVPEDRPCAG